MTDWQLPSEGIPDLREFCFGGYNTGSPDVLLAIWTKSYLTPDQFGQFKRMIHELAQEGNHMIMDVEQMITLIDVVTALY